MREPRSGAAAVAAKAGQDVLSGQRRAPVGIRRATLHRYFPDVEAILLAWHERQIADHLAHLAEVRGQEGDAGRRLKAVLSAYAIICQESHAHHGTELAALLHRGGHLTDAEPELDQVI